MSQSLIPSLRFKEFLEPWLENKLSYFVDINPQKSVCPDDGLVSFIPMNAVSEESQIIYKDIAFYNDVSKGFTSFENDDVLLAKITPCFENGKGAFVSDLLNGIGFGSTEFHVLRSSSKSHSKFIFNYINTSKFRLKGEMKMQGSAGQKRVTTDFLKHNKVTFPSVIEEQQKIASFLTSVDSKINQLTEKHRLLKEYKKGVMQQIFSQQLRFKNEEGKTFPDWEEQLLANIAVFSKGKGISKSDISMDGKIKCIRYGELYTTYGEVIETIISATNISENELILSQANDVIVPSSGETRWDIATAACVRISGVAYSGDLTVIRSQLNGVFLSYYLNSAKKRDIAALSQGSSVIHLYSSHMKCLKIKIPCFKEQQKIAQFLQAIDKKTDAVAAQIKQTKQFKKGLLQQMFV